MQRRGFGAATATDVILQNSGADKNIGGRIKYSIVTTVLNAQRDLFAATVASVRAQTFRDFEWIVVENPPHGCVGELLAAAPELAIRHVRLPLRPSLANARNEAAAAARGRLLAVLDGDDECLPDRLQRQVERFAREPELAVLGGALLAVDAHGHQLGWRRYPSEHAAIVRAMRRFNRPGRSLGENTSTTRVGTSVG